MLQAIRKILPFSGEGRTRPLCYVAGNIGRLQPIAEALEQIGLRIELFDSLPALLEAVGAQEPDLTVFDLGFGVAATEQAIAALAQSQKRGALQLVAPIAVTTYEQIGAVGQLRLSGESKGIKMPQVLQPPYQPEPIKKMAQSLGLRRDVAGPGAVTLTQALKKDWLELWYQPKIDLANKRLIGAEGLIRVRHPKYGTIFPDKFLPGAAEDDMLMLTEQVILTALRDWEELAANGVSVRLAVNTPVSALTKLPIATMLREDRPRSTNWPGLILEVTEDEIVNDLQLANDVADELRAHNCTLAIDDFGAGYSSLARLRQLPFSELKIDRSYVSDCNTDGHNAGLCEVIVELAHRFGLKTVAEGIETHHESHKLQGVGCDVGQGYLFAKPMDKSKFISLLRRRVVKTPEQELSPNGRPHFAGLAKA